MGNEFGRIRLGWVLGLLFLSGTSAWGKLSLAVPMVGFAMTLDPSTDVVPRIFSPNGDGVNDVVFFKVDNPRQTQVAGVIFDMTGAQVSSLLPAPNNLPTADSLYWLSLIHI